MKTVPCTVFWEIILIAVFLLSLPFEWRIAARALASTIPSGLLAKFQLESVSAHSIVVKMVAAGGAAALPTHNTSLARPTSKLEMKITIFDLDRLREFRRSELTANVNPQHYQLFSFDGLLSNTWFAIRIDYRLLYYQTASIGDPGGFQDFPTKQELIVLTKNESSPNSSGNEETGHVRQESSSSYGWPATSVPLAEESVFYFEHIHSSPTHLNVTIATVFAMRPRLTTLIVPELRCLRGTLKPPAQRVSIKETVSFDLKKMALSSQGAVSSPQYYTNNNQNTDPSTVYHLDSSGRGGVKCYQLCIFPFIRAEILDQGQQTFRGKEFCESLDVARQLALQHHRHHAPRLRSPFSTRELSSASLSSNFETDLSFSPSSASTNTLVCYRLAGFILASLLRFHI